MSIHDTKRERPKRKWSGERKGPLAFDIKPEEKKEYMYRVTNDVRTRIADLQEMDYELVDDVKQEEKTVDSANVRKRTGVGVGGGLTARLMRIPREWWEENQRMGGLKRADELERAMKKAPAAGHYGKVEIDQNPPK